MADDAAKRSARLRALMMEALQRPYGPGHIPEPSLAEKEAFADAFVRDSEPYYGRSQGDLL